MTLWLAVVLLSAEAVMCSCPLNWTLNGADGACYHLFPDNLVSSPPTKSFYDAANYCQYLGGSLVTVLNAAQHSFLVALAGPVRKFWIDARIDPSNRSAAIWRSRFGRDLNYTNWDYSFGPPGTQGCAAIQTKSDAIRPGGNDLWITLDCSTRLEYVCQKLLQPFRISIANGLPPPLRIEVVYGDPFTLKVAGTRVSANTMISFQTNTGELPQRELSATGCQKLSRLTGESTPIPVVLTGNNYYHRFCNGTCIEAMVSLPYTWLWKFGANYSLCFFDGYPFDTWEVASEFQNELLPGVFLEVVRKTSDHLRDVCNRRSELVDLFHNDYRLDTNRDPQKPYVWDGDVQTGS